MTQQKQNGNLVAIITMFFIFAMISFVTNLAAPFGTIWRNEYAGSNTLGMMGNMMNFLAYLFMGIPAGNMLVKIGYKKTALIAMAVGFLGLFTQYLSSLFGANVEVFAFGEYVIKLNFVIYLLGAFICGFCVCMLNTVVNPMLNLLGGGGNKGNQLIQTGGALNSLSGTLTPLFVGALIGTVTSKTAMSDVAPLLFVAMGVFVAAFIIISFVAIPEPHLQKGGAKKEKFSHSPWSFRHTLLGVIGIFIYVGIEIGIPGTLNFYLADSSDKGAGIMMNGAAIGGAIAATYGASFLCYVTPAEHLRLPDLNDVKEGIIAARIAAHAADIAKGVPGAIDWDLKMDKARRVLDWDAQFDAAIDPEKARRYRQEAKPEKEDTCSMCGNFCAVKNMNKIMDGEIVSIFDE